MSRRPAGPKPWVPGEGTVGTKAGRLVEPGRGPVWLGSPASIHRVLGNQAHIFPAFPWLCVWSEEVAAPGKGSGMWPQTGPPPDMSWKSQRGRTQAPPQVPGLPGPPGPAWVSPAGPSFLKHMALRLGPGRDESQASVWAVLAAQPSLSHCPPSRSTCLPTWPPPAWLLASAAKPAGRPGGGVPAWGVVSAVV